MDKVMRQIQEQLDEVCNDEHRLEHTLEFIDKGIQQVYVANSNVSIVHMIMQTTKERLLQAYMQKQKEVQQLQCRIKEMSKNKDSEIQSKYEALKREHDSL